MKTLLQDIDVKPILSYNITPLLEFVVKHKLNTTMKKSLIPYNVFIKILEDNEFMIYVAARKYVNDYYGAGYATEEIYIIKTGDNTIAKEYGQDTYDDNSLSGQDIDGTWSKNNSKYTKQNKILQELHDNINLDCCKDESEAKYRYEVFFEKCKYIKSNHKKDNGNLKIYDCRKQ